MKERIGWTRDLKPKYLLFLVVSCRRSGTQSKRLIHSPSLDFYSQGAV